MKYANRICGQNSGILRIAARGTRATKYSRKYKTAENTLSGDRVIIDGISIDDRIYSTL
jgi:hypothetical protein